MAFYHGKGLAFKIDNAAGTLVVLSAYVTEVTLDESIDVAETTTAGAEAKTYVSGQTDATLSISGNYDETAVSGPNVVLAALRGLETTSTFEFGPSGSTAGKAKKSGECFMTGFSTSAPSGGVVTFTADFQVTAGVTEGVWP